MNRHRKAYRSGAHLLVDPRQTLARVMPLMPRLGITRVANVTGLDRIGIPVVMVCRPNSRSIAVSQGKGVTLDAAKASGLMESIESWHAERIELPLKLGSFNDLSPSNRLIDLDRLPALRGSVYRPGLPLLWIEGRNLLDNEDLWLPFETVHTYYAHPSPGGSGCFAQSSNGLASGNHYLEAASHAICECVERDASSLWHQQEPFRRAATKLDLHSIDDACCCLLLEQLAAADFEVTLWNTTSDTAIPAFECVIMDKRDARAHPGQGAGCHPHKSIALVRAITEAVQVRTTYIAGSRDDLTQREYATVELDQKIRAFRNLVGEEEGRVDFQALPGREFDSLEEDLDWLLDRLRAVGIEQVACVDLTRPGLDIAVVRMVIPGLEGPHDDDDYLPGPRARALQRGAA